MTSFENDTYNDTRNDSDAYGSDAYGSTTTRSDDPEVIRRNIDATRADLSRDVDALTEKVRPARVVERKVDRAKEPVASVKAKAKATRSPPA